MLYTIHKIYNLTSYYILFNFYLFMIKFKILSKHSFLLPIGLNVFFLNAEVKFISY